jgi:anthranilate phosphoribosyltransferase
MIYSADFADSMEAGVERARAVLTSKAGAAKLDELCDYTQQFTE